MKIIMKPIEVIGWFNIQGVLIPIKFNAENKNGKQISVKVNQVVDQTEEKIAGNPTRSYSCKVIINGMEKTCELKYELSTCKWILYKI